MVDVGEKALTARRAVAEAWIRLDAKTCDLLFAGALPKGEALAVARIAGIQAAKDTSRLIPLCHTLALSHVGVHFERDGEDRVRVEVEASTVAGTGVEMEAMAGASVAVPPLQWVRRYCDPPFLAYIEQFYDSLPVDRVYGPGGGVYRRGW